MLPSPVAAAFPLAGSPLLAVQLAVVAAAAWACGASVALIHLGHRRMQVLLSFTGGILLGVALLHLLPHATAEFGGRVSDATPWVLAGFFLMFLLERAFHGQAHHAVDPHHGPRDGCDHGHAAGHGRGAGGGPWGWCGTLAGLGIHSLADGAALAAAADVAVDGGGPLAGSATFLAILLHKPIDAALIAALMLKSGASPGVRNAVNIGHALLVPLGAALFMAGIADAGDHRHALVGAALGLAAGAFLCIAAADLLPEVEFHSHDRLLLSVTLVLGITAATAMTSFESFFAAEARSGQPALHEHPDEGR